MRFRDCFYAWNPVDCHKNGAVPGQVQVGPYPDESGWSDQFQSSQGALNLDDRALMGVDLKFRILADFHTMVVRDGVDPTAAHREFLRIDEYRELISPDIEGASPE
ncbi:MAG: hypothetical protein IPL88_11095 [Rhizobiales bacterium]|nr:hypothetical protein [Hyphomicrobiales bacterium]